jgi:hypothetical protein
MDFDVIRPAKLVKPIDKHPEDFPKSFVINLCMVVSMAYELAVLF